MATVHSDRIPQEVINPEDRAVLEGERDILEWLRSRGSEPGTGTPAGRWIEAYVGAGRAALAKEVEPESWLYLRIELRTLKAARRVIARLLYPTLSRLAARGIIKRFWFLLKGDTCYHLRLRIFGETEALRAEAQVALLGVLQPGNPRSGVTICRELMYEPETALFGGAWALEQVHELFHHDSLFAMAWLGLRADDKAQLSDHQTSVIMVQHFLRSAGLDTFERWDVWNKVHKLRPGDLDQLSAAWETSQDDMRLLVNVNPQAIVEALPPKGRKALADYVGGLRQTGEALGAGNREGLLERGLRHIVATSTVFHWNRMLFSGWEQTMLAYFMSKAAAPLED